MKITKFELVAENGTLFVDINGNSLVTFRPGAYLQIGSIEIVGSDETARREEWASSMGRMIGRELAEQEARS